MKRVIGQRRAVVKPNLGGGVTAPNKPRNPNVGPGRPASGAQGLGNRQAVDGSGKGLSAAPQPGAPPPVSAPTPMPWDVQAANDLAGVKKIGEGKLASLTSQWGVRQQEYGLGASGGWDPSQFANNPYSMAALLQRSHDIANRANLTGSGRQLYAGSRINQRNYDLREFNRGKYDLETGWDRDYIDYQADKQGIEDWERDEEGRINWDKINTALAAEPEPIPGGGGNPRLQLAQKARRFSDIAQKLRGESKPQAAKKWAAKAKAASAKAKKK